MKRLLLQKEAFNAKAADQEVSKENAKGGKNLVTLWRDHKCFVRNIGVKWMMFKVNGNKLSYCASNIVRKSKYIMIIQFSGV